MAKVHGLGMFSGKMGDKVYFIKNGKCYARAYVKKSDPNTWMQQMQRARFAVIQQFLKPLLEVIRIGYSAPNPPMTSYNEAVKTIFRTALINTTAPDDDHPSFMIDYSKVRLSRGLIEHPRIKSFSRTGQEITITWDSNLRSDYNHHYDKCLLVAMNSPEKVYINANIGQRSDGIGKVTLPPELTDLVNVWLFFYNNEVRTMNRKTVSDSVYLGKG